MSTLEEAIKRRRTFAIISHPDAGKTTVTEKLLLLGGAINIAGTVKARKSNRYAAADWMAIEKQRGISVTSSVMQFDYGDHIINLLDTPGHEDFSEDTYRVLSAVDSALMVIDAAKGVEERTIKLLEICRLRNMPIITLVNKLDRHAREPLDLLDEMERILDIQCAPITWPLGSGQHFAGVYELATNCVIPYQREDHATSEREPRPIAVADLVPESELASALREYQDEIELISEAGHGFDLEAYRAGLLTPVFFGSALRNFGIQALLDFFVDIAPPPLPRETSERLVQPLEPRWSGFVFKIQANMDPQHRDRIAFLRVCSGHFESGLRVHHVRTGRTMAINNAVTFMAQGRERLIEAWPGDILGLHNHGTIQVGDTFTQGEKLNFKGLPNFAPELFRRVRSRDPLKAKALLKGLTELGEEGAAQVFRYLTRNDIVVGAIGPLQFDVVAHRLEHEYGVDCVFETIGTQAARWVTATEAAELERFKRQLGENLALDGNEYLVYLAPSRVNLDLTIERWPQLEFHATRERGG